MGREKDREPLVWWKRGIVYQIYPRSFCDADGDGIGDLQGILRGLDYLQWLGVDAIWLSPIFPSPMADFGYDISDYTDVHPMFGSLEDLDQLIEEVHRRDMRLLLDLVPNHTSDQHPWFQESRASRDNPKRDWYLWHDPAAGGGPPNNWLSVFGGPAWTLDETTGQYYYHAFLREQPDLNWRNPEVRQAMFDVMRFWLDRGVDGFRVDVMWHMIKDTELRDNPVNPDFDPTRQIPYHQLLPVWSTDQPEVHDVVRQMRAVMDEYDERVLVGELYLPVEQLVTYYGDENDEAHLPFNFSLISLPWQARTIDAAISTYEAALPKHGWPNWVLGNHDKSRVASRVGACQARVAQMLLLTLRGTPTMYYGDELSMRDVDVPPDRLQDPQALRQQEANVWSRDCCRTPMQWDDSPHAGFSSAEPWLPVSESFREMNVAIERDAPRSMLNLVRRLIALRREHHALHGGGYEPLPQQDDALLGYIRRGEGRGPDVLVALNLGDEPRSLDLEQREGVILVSTQLDRDDEEVSGALKLRGDEGCVVRLLARDRSQP